LKRPVKIYGERNTGTNYIDKLIRMNLEADLLNGVAPGPIQFLQRALPGKQLVRDTYFQLTYGRNLGWKHTAVKPESELRRYDIVKKGVCFITVTKNPYSWLLSLHRRPYHHYYGEKPDFETFLRTSWKTVGRDNCEGLLPDPIELWNIKNRSYLRLQSLKGVNITSESVLADPKALIDKLSDSFSIPRSKNYFSNLDKSTKDKSKNFDYYNDYYLNERWKEELSDESVSIINSRLDRALVDYFSYELLET
jgi:hypothetical protein